VPGWVTLEALRNNLHFNRLDSCADASEQAGDSCIGELEMIADQDKINQSTTQVMELHRQNNPRPVGLKWGGAWLR